ncbi:cupin domain-containing protein [Aureibaculum algae]|uniref:Cupin domain-containing protein n=1 Tax=Aureibaculum algae TaxID=2584122 RepID=A0A5B7TNH8_9FLAO|nr:cupin domain-containing protein [Aureibaculum algae]QCX38165.1 cupin domain-containing protein [Aureibaculum algae]
MIKNKNVIKVMVLGVLFIIFTMVQGCGKTKDNHKKANEQIAEISLEEEGGEPHTHKEEIEPHTHSHSPQSDPGKRILKPEDVKGLWVFPESKDKLGSGGLLKIYMDAESHPQASSGFAKYELGVGGALPEHKHNKTEEIAYFLSGKGIVISYENNKKIETVVEEGYVWYTAPGEWHSFKNTGDVPLKLVFATIPNAKHGLLNFFKKVSAEPGKQATALSAEEFAKLASENDMILKPAKIE